MSVVLLPSSAVAVAPLDLVFVSSVSRCRFSLSDAALLLYYALMLSFAIIIPVLEV